jgi:hypothetical protein
MDFLGSRLWETAIPEALQKGKLLQQRKVNERHRVVVELPECDVVMKGIQTDSTDHRAAYEEVRVSQRTQHNFASDTDSPLSHST